MLIGNKLDLCEEDQKCRAVAYKNAEELAEVSERKYQLQPL
jgi:hypothetical protein